MIKGPLFLDEKYEGILLLLKPGVWYCFSDYAGCDAMPECEGSISSRLVTALEEKGYVKSVPVFEGFMTRKHQITPKGIAWLAAR